MKTNVVSRPKDVSRRPAASLDVPPCPHIFEIVKLSAWAENLSRELLSAPLPRRWAHTQGVASRARELGAILGDDADLLEGSAWLHDIGYAPSLVDTGLHPLDGARYLRDSVQGRQMLCRLVAHHSYALLEAEERGLAGELDAEFESPPSDLADALTWCDMTTGPDGELVSVEDRLSDILSRYDEHDVVSHFIKRAGPSMIEAVGRVDRRLAVDSQVQSRYGHGDSET